MWNMTARGLGVRAYNSGGARGTVDKLDTSTLLSSMTGKLFAGEARQLMEHFEPFGITSAIVSKNADGVAEGVMSFLTGARAHALASVISDRRYRFLGLKEGETAQHDDVGQTTIIRRTGVYVAAFDGPVNANAQTEGADNDNRMASLRHANKQKQPRKQMTQLGSAGGSGGSTQQSTQSQDFKHEGDSVNTEVRCDKNHVYVFDGENAVATYDKQAKTWTFQCDNDFKVTSGSHIILEAPQIKLGKDAVTPVKLCDDSCAQKVFAE